MEPYFNIAGPCVPGKHYMLPALDRLPEMRRLVSREQYFVLHAPRQIGKTTALKELVREINSKGEMVAIYCTLETLRGATDPARAASAIASLLWFNAKNVMPDLFNRDGVQPCVHEVTGHYAAEALAVREALTSLCRLADMPGLMAAFQSFWRENSGADRHVFAYGEVTPHLFLMAFLQRVTNGKGRIMREMALGCGRLDLCVEYRRRRCAVEVKTANNFAGEKSYGQIAQYLSTLGLGEGWMPVSDPDTSKSWEEKLYMRDVVFNGKTIHVVGL